MLTGGKTQNIGLEEKIKQQCSVIEKKIEGCYKSKGYDGCVDCTLFIPLKCMMRAKLKELKR